MGKHMKRVISWILAVILLMNSMGLTVWADEMMEEEIIEEILEEPEEVLEEEIIEEPKIEEIVEEVIPEASASLDMPVKPYSTHYVDFAEEDIEVSGSTFRDALIFEAGYSFSTYNPQVNYNFKGQYSSLTFSAGFYEGWERDATLTVIADGVTVIDGETLAYDGSPRSFKVNLSGVHQLNIRMDSEGYDKVWYAIGNFNLVKKASTPTIEVPLASNMFYSCEPSSITSAEVVSGEFEMGGYTYIDGIKMTMGYGWTSKETASVKFNFDNHYKSLSFDIGSYGSDIVYRRAANLMIIADGVTLYEDEVLTWDGIPKNYQINLNGVKELEIKTTSNGYDKVYYSIGNIRMVSDGKVRGITFKETSVKVTPDQPTVQLEPVVIPNDANNQNYTLKTDKSIIALVDEKGLVTGRHKGTAIITATTEEGGYEGTCTVSSTLPVTKYVPSVHGWGFTNQQLDPTEVDDDGIHVEDYYEDIYRRIAPQYRLYSNVETLTNDWLSVPNGWSFLYYTFVGMAGNGGMCYGFSLSSALTYTGDIPFSYWSNWEQDTTPKNPGEVKGDAENNHITHKNGYSTKLDLYLKQYVYACFIAQGNHDSKTELFVNSLNPNVADTIIDLTKSFQETGKNPILIRMSRNDGAVHMVVPYEVIEYDDHLDVYIYDPNLHVDKNQDPDDEKITFKINSKGKITSWERGNYTSANTKLSYESNLKKVADRIKNMSVFDRIGRFISTTSESFSIKKGDKTILKYSNGEYTGDATQTDLIPVKIAGNFDGSAYTDAQLIYQMSDEEITIIYDDTSQVTTFFGYDDSAVVIQSDGKSKVSTAPDEGKSTVSVTPSTSGTVTVKYNEADEDSIEYAGTTGSKVTVTKKDDSKEMEIQGFDKVTITKVEDGKTQMNIQEGMDSDFSYSVSEDFKVEPIIVPVEKVTISALSGKIAAGKKMQLTATVSPKNVKTKAVTWKSSNKAVAAVDSNGLVTVKSGTGGKTATITATAQDGSGVKGTYKITSMKGVVTAVKVSGATVVQDGQTAKLSSKVTATTGANKTLSWSSSNTKYATISSKGVVTGKSAGVGKTVTITAKATDGSGKKATYKVKVIEALTTPANAKAQSSTYNAIKLSWSKVSNATGYEIYVKVGSGSWKYLTKTTKTSYTHKNLKTGTKYSYKVRAYRVIDGNTLYGSYCTAVSGKPVPKQVTISGLTTTKGSAKLTWGKITGATGYRIYYKASDSSSWKTLKTIKKGSTVTYTHKGLTSGKSIDFKIRAYRTVSGKQIWGSYSKVKTIKIK